MASHLARRPVRGNKIGRHRSCWLPGASGQQRPRTLFSGFGRCRGGCRRGGTQRATHYQGRLPLSLSPEPRFAGRGMRCAHARCLCAEGEKSPGECPQVTGARAVLLRPLREPKTTYIHHLTRRATVDNRGAQRPHPRRSEPAKQSEMCATPARRAQTPEAARGAAHTSDTCLCMGVCARTALV